MKLVMQSLGNYTKDLNFWKDSGSAETKLSAPSDCRLIVLTGANGCGKSSILKSILSNYPDALIEEDSSYQKMVAKRLAEDFGNINVLSDAGSTAFSPVLYYDGRNAATSPGSVYTLEDFFRVHRARQSHGEGCVDAFVNKIIKPAKELATPEPSSNPLILLDEPEAGLSIELLDLALSAFVHVLEFNPRVLSVVATQSILVKSMLEKFASPHVVDMGGWRDGNPFNKWRIQRVES